MQDMVQKGVPYWDMVEGNLHLEVVVEVLCTVADSG